MVVISVSDIVKASNESTRAEMSAKLWFKKESSFYEIFLNAELKVSYSFDDGDFVTPAVSSIKRIDIVSVNVLDIFDAKDNSITQTETQITDEIINDLLRSYCVE